MNPYECLDKLLLPISEEIYTTEVKFVKNPQDIVLTNYLTLLKTYLEFYNNPPIENDLRDQGLLFNIFVPVITLKGIDIFLGLIQEIVFSYWGQLFFTHYKKTLIKNYKRITLKDVLSPLLAQAIMQNEYILNNKKPTELYLDLQWYLGQKTKTRFVGYIDPQLKGIISILSSVSGHVFLEFLQKFYSKTFITQDVWAFLDISKNNLTLGVKDIVKTTLGDILQTLLNKHKKIPLIFKGQLINQSLSININIFLNPDYEQTIELDKPILNMIKSWYYLIKTINLEQPEWFYKFVVENKWHVTQPYTQELLKCIFFHLNTFKPLTLEYTSVQLEKTNEEQQNYMLLSFNYLKNLGVRLFLTLEEISGLDYNTLNIVFDSMDIHHIINLALENKLNSIMMGILYDKLYIEKIPVVLLPFTTKPITELEEIIPDIYMVKTQPYSNIFERLTPTNPLRPYPVESPTTLEKKQETIEIIYPQQEKKDLSSILSKPIEKLHPLFVEDSITQTGIVPRKFYRINYYSPEELVFVFLNVKNKNQLKLYEDLWHLLSYIPWFDSDYISDFFEELQKTTLNTFHLFLIISTVPGFEKYLDKLKIKKEITNNVVETLLNTIFVDNSQNITPLLEFIMTNTIIDNYVPLLDTLSVIKLLNPEINFEGVFEKLFEEGKTLNNVFILDLIDIQTFDYCSLAFDETKWNEYLSVPNRPHTKFIMDKYYKL